MNPPTLVENRREACKTYIEQTKLLVTLASGFLLAPPAALSILTRGTTLIVDATKIQYLMWAEGLLVVSVLAGYFTLASIAGSQDEGEYNVYRKATVIFSLAQIGAYLIGLGVFVFLIRAVLSQ
jgi:hypothetical protein